MKLEEFLYIKLNQLKEVVSMEDYEIKCYFEQEFINKEIKEKEIHVIIKRMTSSLTFNTITTPYQILVLSEQNSMEMAVKLLDLFATNNNWTVISEGTSKIKLQFSQPMIMSNFEIVGVGYRSVLFVSATTYELENVADLDGELEVNGETIKYITFQIGFGTSGDSQPFPNRQLVSTVKTVSSLSIQITIPCVNTTLFQDIQKIWKGIKSGNSTFNFKFKLSGGENFDIDMKLIAAAFATAKNDIPSLELGFTV